MLHLTFDQRSMGYMKLVKQWPKRTEAMGAQLMYYAAERLLQDVMNLIPTTPDWEAYRRSLEVVGVDGVAAAFAVRVNARRAGVRAVDPATELVYVEPRRKMAQTPAAITVLEKYSPWTAETLPFTPKRGDARLMIKKVTPAEVVQVARKRRRDRPKWRKELDRAGARVDTKDQRAKTKSGYPDVALAGLGLEFGIGIKRKSHWGPSVRRIAQGGIKSVFEDHPTLKRALRWVSFTGWSRWPRQTRNHLSAADVVKLKTFADRLG